MGPAGGKARQKQQRKLAFGTTRNWGEQEWTLADPILDQVGWLFQVPGAYDRTGSAGSVEDSADYGAGGLECPGYSPEARAAGVDAEGFVVDMHSGGVADSAVSVAGGLECPGYSPEARAAGVAEAVGRVVDFQHLECVELAGGGRGSCFRIWSQIVKAGHLDQSGRRSDPAAGCRRGR